MTTSKSAAAALESVARHHGLALTPASTAALLGTESPGDGIFGLLVTARRLGLEAVPLEGDYDGLVGVPTPNIVILRSAGGEERFAALVEIDEGGAVIRDPESGEPSRLDRDELAAVWTGDCVQIEPHPERFAAVREKLELLQSPGYRLRSALALTPPFLPKAFFVLAVLAVAVLLAGVRVESSALRWAVSALALAFLTSLWSWLLTASCRACSAAGALVGGQPLAAAGTACYALLLGSGLAIGQPGFPSSAAWVWGGSVFAAVGVHLTLVALLAGARILCWPCLLTALWVFLAAGALASSAQAPRAAEAAAVAAFFAGAAWIETRYARRRFRHRSHGEALELARAVSRESDPRAPGQVRLVVYKRRSCPLCLYYESILRPAIEQELGESIRIDERDAGARRVPLPLFVILGTLDLAVFDVPMESAWDLLRESLRQAGDRAFAPLRALDGLHVITRGTFPESGDPAVESGA